MMMNAKQTTLSLLTGLLLMGCAGSGGKVTAPPMLPGEGTAVHPGGHSPEQIVGEDGPQAPPPMAAQTPSGGAAEGNAEHPARRAKVGPGTMADDRGRSMSKPFQPTPTRPGLATRWGERRSSHVTSAPFQRANPSHALAIGKLFYNDAQGLSQMRRRQHHGFNAAPSRLFPLAQGHLEFGLRDSSGRNLRGFSSGGNNYVAGSRGSRYTIIVKNHSPARIEVVISVDGLDVIDGQPASPRKRGYLIDAFDELEVDGFRRSTAEVAAFRFGNVDNSYAARKHGNTRNVGVIGVAAFHERGTRPQFWGLPGRDPQRRHNADPFPQRFASPPR